MTPPSLKPFEENDTRIYKELEKSQEAGIPVSIARLKAALKEKVH
ncbi:MAG: hypothetical protein WD016_11690 [Balneolaceae bacterium]